MYRLLAAGGFSGALSACSSHAARLGARSGASALCSLHRPLNVLSSHHSSSSSYVATSCSSSNHNNNTNNSSSSSSRGLCVVHASSSEVGPKKKKGSSGGSSGSSSGSKSQHQHAGEGSSSKQQQHVSSSSSSSREREREVIEWDDEDSDDEEDNFLAPYLDAVVKVYCVHTEPNYSLPWQRKRQYTSTSTGFVAAGGERWLLTNAHSVDYHTQVKVKKRGDDQKFLARVLALGVDCDIALLTVDDPAFWEGLTALEFGPLPQLQDTVAVVGYPIGGDTISVTAGVVSRIEVTQYSHGSIDLLGIQIDAAINGGNSGGPVFNKRGQCCGIAFQGLSGSDVENVGYVIPTPVVNHFVTDYLANGRFTGFPGLGIQWQRMESEALRKAHKMKQGQKGVLIRRVNQTSAAAQQLLPGDVLLSFDGQAIANDGTVPFRTGERISFSHLISKKFVGESAKLEVLRDGQPLSLDVTLSRPGVLVPPHLSNRNPSYFVVGGLVFTVAAEPYLESEYGEHWPSEAPVKILDALYYGMPNVEGQQVVLLSQVLADDSTLGYEDMSNMQVLAVNGTPIVNLQHLAQVVTTAKDDYLCFDCDYNETIVVNRQQATQCTRAVLQDHSIPAAMSADVQQALGDSTVWPPPEAAAAVQEQGADGGGGERGAASAVVVAAAAATDGSGSSIDVRGSSSSDADGAVGS